MLFEEKDRMKTVLLSISSAMQQKCENEQHHQHNECQIKGPKYYDRTETPIQFLVQHINREVYCENNPSKKRSLHHNGSSPSLVILQRNGWPLQYT